MEYTTPAMPMGVATSGISTLRRSIPAILQLREPPEQAPRWANSWTGWSITLVTRDTESRDASLDLARASVLLATQCW
jgi:hypothetical protein